MPTLPVLGQKQIGPSFRVKSPEMTISVTMPQKQYEVLWYDPKIAHVCYRTQKKQTNKQTWQNFPFLKNMLSPKIYTFW